MRSKNGILASIMVAILLTSAYFSIKSPKKKDPIPSTKQELFSSLDSFYRPTKSDYTKIQSYLTYGRREELDTLSDMESRMRGFRLSYKKRRQESGIIYVNSRSTQKEKCILLYASFNQNYPEALKSSIESIQKSDFQGHILYPIGGWPNCEEGDLQLVTTPYAFKIALLREAKRLGYKKLLWLDSSITPLISYQSLFNRIEKEGYLTVGNTHNVGPYFNESAALALGISLKETDSIPSVSAGILGLNLTNTSSIELLDRWYQAELDPKAFFSPRSDQNALSIILHQMNLPMTVPYCKIAECNEQINESTLFLIDREKTQKKHRKKI